MTDPGWDPVRIAGSLGVADAWGPQRVEGGADTLIWRVETRSGPVAVRVFRADQQAAATREREALDAARSAGIPTPAVVAHGRWEVRPVTVLEWCTGEPLLDRLLAGPADAVGLGREFGRTQAAIHRVEPPGSWALRSAGVLLHLDYHPLNVLVEGDRITAVLDWVNTRAGDVRMDVARTYSILIADPRARDFDRCLVARFRRAWLEGYAEAASARPRPLARFIARAGEEMARDLKGRHTAAELDRVTGWARGWARRGGPDARSADPGGPPAGAETPQPPG